MHLSTICCFLFAIYKVTSATFCDPSVECPDLQCPNGMDSDPYPCDCSLCKCPDTCLITCPNGYQVQGYDSSNLCKCVTCSCGCEEVPSCAENETIYSNSDDCNCPVCVCDLSCTLLNCSYNTYSYSNPSVCACPVCLECSNVQCGFGTHRVTGDDNCPTCVSS